MIGVVLRAMPNFHHTLDDDLGFQWDLHYGFQLAKELLGYTDQINSVQGCFWLFHKLGYSKAFWNHCVVLVPSITPVVWFLSKGILHFLTPKHEPKGSKGIFRMGQQQIWMRGGQLLQAAAMVSLYFLANPQLPAHSAHLVFRKAWHRKRLGTCSTCLKPLISNHSTSESEEISTAAR